MTEGEATGFLLLASSSVQIAAAKRRAAEQEWPRRRRLRTKGPVLENYVHRIIRFELCRSAELYETLQERRISAYRYKEPELPLRFG